MTRQQREELNKLSKEVFGVSSKWQKLVGKGVSEPYERDREVMVPTRKGLEKKVFTDKKSVLKHYTVEEVKKLMEDLLAKRSTPFLKAERNAVLDALTVETEKLGLEFK